MPAGVDSRACGPVPGEAEAISRDSEDLALSFALPLKNIGCDFWAGDTSNSDTVDCLPMEYSFDPPSSETASEPNPFGDGAEGWEGQWVLLDTETHLGRWASEANRAFYALQDGSEEIRILKYGQMVSLGDIACLSGNDGVTCWNGKTGHGFRLSKDSQLKW